MTDDCSKLAWSSAGSIAQIVEDGERVIFRALASNSVTRAWALTGESGFTIVAPQGRKWKHVQFNGLGLDMVVIDERGTMYMHSLVGALGNMPIASGGIERDTLAKSELDVVAGMHWLPVLPNEFKVGLDSLCASSSC